MTVTSLLDDGRDEAALSIRELACTVGLRPLFEGLAFDLGAGTWLRLAGPNGCGKSTLLRAISGLIRPTAGEVFWHGRLRESGSPLWVGEVLYQGHLAGWKEALSPAENLALQLTLDRGRAASLVEVAAHLGRTGLSRQAHLPFQRLSAGQRQRLSLARLAASHQTLWLLDEPTSALDAEGQRLFGELLDTHLARGGCALVATHLPIDCETASHQLELARYAPRRR